MNQDYVDLKNLAKNAGYQKLEALWMYQVSKVEEERDRAAKKGNETAWRYWAGKEAGFKLAMTAVQRALLEMEQKAVDVQEEENDPVTKLFEEMKLKGEPL